MEKLNTVKTLLCCAFMFSFFVAKAQSFEGIVKDKESNETIPFVEIYFVDLKTGTTTDENGIFKIENFNQKKIHVQISYIGFETIDEIINTDSTRKKIFYLEQSHFELKEVIVSAPVGNLQRESVVAVEQKKMTELQETSPITLAEAISNIPGVEQNTTGAGIGKPVIRGLSGNRIVTFAQGIRIENQQWGDEHGLGVGEIGIESVEVIKGPASLLYGSDALGGVLYFVDERYAKHNTLEISGQSRFVSNSLGSINDVGFKINKNNLKFNLFSSFSSHADYKTANLERVFNTRFDEKNIKSSLGFNNNNWISNIRYSFLQNNFGIIEDATYSVSKERDFPLPFQTIKNHNLSFDNKFYLKDAQLSAVLGYTSNYRREFEDSETEQALGMYLNTFTYNLKYTSSLYKDRFNFVIGTQGMSQDNENNGEEILIPDATTRDIGAFVLGNLEFEKIQFQTGVRFDNRNIDTKNTQNIGPFNQSYNGVTYSGGAVYSLDKIKIRANVSSGFRAPNTSELLSDGVHEGTNRYEKGNTNLTSEKATQIDFSFDYQNEHFQFSINPFYNYIKDYIFLSPTDMVIDDNPVFEYLQTDAFLYGGELGIHFHPHQIHWLHVESNLSAVAAEDKNKNALPLIPQTKINTTLSAEFPRDRKVNLSNVYLQHIYKFQQNRIGDFETPTNDYSLVNMGMTFEIKTANNPVEINAGVKNVFNTKYLDHLSRFKNLGIANPGINIYLGIKLQLTRNL